MISTRACKTIWVGHLLSQRFRSTSKLLIASMLALGYCEHMGGIKQWLEPEDIVVLYLDFLLIYFPKSKNWEDQYDQEVVSTGRLGPYYIRSPHFLITLHHSPPPTHTHTHTHRPCLTVWRTPCFLRGFQLPDHRWQLVVHPREHQNAHCISVHAKILWPIQFLGCMLQNLEGLDKWMWSLGWITSYCILYKHCRALTGFRMDEVWQWIGTEQYFWSVQLQ